MGGYGVSDAWGMVLEGFPSGCICAVENLLLSRVGYYPLALALATCGYVGGNPVLPLLYHMASVILPTTFSSF